ncbi:MAG: hypothetical protein IKU19_04685, partial [Clostridia bacterium]|nr:hypothetical protein [Clostridia bacterium]
MNKKNIALVVVLLLLVISVIALFMLVVKPLIAEEIEPEVVPETQEGESLGVLGKYQIHDRLDRSRIAKIHVHNSVDDYSFVRDKSGEFVIEGMEELPYNEKYFSALVSIVGNPLALVKVDSDDSGYEEYGIRDSQVYWEVTSTTGEVYRMTVGHMTHTGGGYYVAYEG